MTIALAVLLLGVAHPLWAAVPKKPAAPRVTASVRHQKQVVRRVAPVRRPVPPPKNKVPEQQKLPTVTMHPTPQTAAAVPAVGADARQPILAPKVPPSASVRINGRALTAAQLDAFAATYGARPKAGDYWYDTVSGLYGTVGQPAAGFMVAGQAFGPLAGDASRGDSGVFFNGRELTRSEVAIVESLIHTTAPPGRYWFAANGNVGLEGSIIPLVNLAATGGSSGGRGDSFWSTHFSAGNSNADNSQGYVSVPGYGPVGYGF